MAWQARLWMSAGKSMPSGITMGTSACSIWHKVLAAVNKTFPVLLLEWCSYNSLKTQTKTNKKQTLMLWDPPYLNRVWSSTGKPSDIPTWGSSGPSPPSPPSAPAGRGQTTVPVRCAAAAARVAVTQLLWRWSWSSRRDHSPQPEPTKSPPLMNSELACFRTLWCDVPGFVFWCLDPHSWKEWRKHQNPPEEAGRQAAS